MADAVASAVLRRYASLPKHGKPQPGEYTLLAGFAVTDDAVPDAPAEAERAEEHTTRQL